MRRNYGLGNLLNVVFFVPGSKLDAYAKHYNCEGHAPAAQLTTELL